MTGPAGLEQRYRRLLGWYPEPFRSEREEEMFAVLMAGARPGQRRPRSRLSSTSPRIRRHLSPARVFSSSGREGKSHDGRLGLHPGTRGG
jgi:hypothetical protein